MCIAQRFLTKYIFIPNEKMLSSPVLKGTGVLKNSTYKLILWWYANDSESLFLMVRQGNPLQASIHIYKILFVLLYS